MNLPKFITDQYPNAKFVQSENWDIEDDSIELSENESIQITMCGTYVPNRYEGEGENFCFISGEETRSLKKAMEFFATKETEICEA